MRRRALSLTLMAAVLSAWSGEPDLSGCFPPAIKTVGVVMPASILKQKSFDEGIRALEKAGYRVKKAQRLSFDKLAPLKDRVSDFEEMWLDPEVDLVLCARGGEGAEAVVRQLDWQKLARRPDQRVLGFSNITMILNAMLRKGVGHPFSGPSISQMLYCKGDTLEWLCKSLAGKPLPATQLRPLKPGPFSGLPCGGHIHYVSMGARNGWGADMRGRVVFLERNNSATLEGIRQELDAIAESGALEKAAGVIFGDVTPAVTRHKGLADQVAQTNNVDEVKRAFANKMKCPVYDGYAYGHIPVSHAIDFRREVQVSENGLMTWK